MRTAIVLTLLVAASVACLGPPSRVRGPAPDFLRAQVGRRVWATLTDGTNVVLEQPQVIADTVVAISEGMLLAVPVDRIAEVRVKRVSPIRTGVLVLGLGTLAAFLVSKGSPSKQVPIDSSDFYGCRLQPNPALYS